METVYESKGNVTQAMPIFISLILGIGMVTFLQIFIGILSGQLYQQTEADINAITNNTTKNYIKASINNNFKAQATASQYTNLIVIAGVVSLIIVLIFGAFASVGLGTGAMNYGGGGGAYGGGYGRVL
ncbi:MAG: hypothetical protein V3U92_19645 [Cellulophaga sp.]